MPNPSTRVSPSSLYNSISTATPSFSTAATDTVSRNSSIALEWVTTTTCVWLAAARSLPSSASTGVRVPDVGESRRRGRVHPKAVVEAPAAQPVPDSGKFRMRVWVGVFGEHTAVGRQRSRHLLEASPGFRAGLGVVAGATRQRRAGPQQPAHEHRLALDLRVEREQRIVSGHLWQPQVDQIAEIIGGEAAFE